MRKMYLLFPTTSMATKLAPSECVAASELKEQKMINEELIRICEHQRRLLTEQSMMIEEILEGIGR